MTRWLLFLCGLAPVSSGCREVTPTQLVVWVDTDLPDSAWDEVALEVTGPDGRAYRGTVEALPVSFGIRPKHDDPRRRASVAATALRDGAHLLDTASATTFLEHQQLRLDVFLSHRCLGVTCPPGQTCRRGGCEDIDVDPESLPSGSDPPDAVDAAVLRDASVDAAVPDAAVPDAAADAAVPDAAVPDAAVDAGPAPCDACDALAQTGCQDGQTCRFYDAGCSRCERPGPEGVGGLCRADGDCAAGLGCVLVDGAGTCQPYCDASADCPGGSCLSLGVPGLGICTGTCDPFDDACPAGTQCVVLVGGTVEGDPVPTFLCIGTGSLAEGDACQLTGCAPGLQCSAVKEIAGGVCRPYCRDALDCGGLQCAAFEVPGGGPPLAIGVCTSDCDPVLLLGCPAERSCQLLSVRRPSDGAQEYAVECASTGPQAVGDSCAVDACVPGAVCMVGTCRAACETGGSGCDVSETCTSTPVPAIVGAHEYGYCL